MYSEDDIKEIMTKMAEKPKANKVLLKETARKDKADLIESIIEHDKLIQAYVEDHQPIETTELENQSTDELTERLDIGITYLRHLIKKDTVN